MAQIAAHHLKVDDPESLVFEDERIHQEGYPERSIEFATVAEKAYNALQVPAGMEPTIFEYTAFAPTNNSFPFGTHIAVVEVDRETGAVKVLKYFAVDDCGKLLNPLVVEGQVHGGVVQGVGQALLEEIVYDENGQLLTSTLADYSIPPVDMMPEMHLDRTVTPTYTNPLGIKGIGEAGAIAGTPVIVNAVEDALSEYGAVIERMPLRSDYVLSIIKGSGKKDRAAGHDLRF
jgi:aerobic carbon-monoxide dehydrogenase large subunit